MPNHNLPPILAGLMSAVLFLLPLFTGGQLLGLFSILPLFYVGLNRGTGAVMGAALAATIPIAFMAVGAVINFALVNAIPALIFTYLALRPAPGGAEPAPIGLVMVELTAYAALTMGIMFLLQEIAGPPLVEVLREELVPAEQGLAPEMASRLKMLVETTPFLLLAFTTWFLLMIIYVNAWLANYLLKLNKKSLRPALELGEYNLPSWLLGAVSLMALGAVIGGETIQLVAKTLLLILLFPYFLFGLSLLHRATELWPSRGLWRALLYLLMVTVWPAAFIVAIYGLWKQAAQLSQSGKRNS